VSLQHSAGMSHLTADVVGYYLGRSYESELGR
jgi:hypothetical protein